ncbi:Hypothetical protein A7982_02534 [Minicystis rosea]|nr:Hypothetical protein A7982_02534 [Minicystis rosea]
MIIDHEGGDAGAITCVSPDIVAPGKPLLDEMGIRSGDGA